MNKPLLYSKAYEEYKLRLQGDFHYALSTYCSEKSISYSGMKNWLLSRGIFVRTLQAQAMAAAHGGLASSASISCHQESFIQFRPGKCSSSDTVIRGVSITFPDGVNLSLQECSTASVVSLLEIYESRKAGRMV